jgi:hypothetical protein
VAGALGVAFWAGVVYTPLHHYISSPSALLIGAMIVLGLIAVVAGVIAVIRGPWLMRLIGVIGTLAGLWLLLAGVVGILVIQTGSLLT